VVFARTVLKLEAIKQVRPSFGPDSDNSADPSFPDGNRPQDGRHSMLRFSMWSSKQVVLVEEPTDL